MNLQVILIQILILHGIEILIRLENISLKFILLLLIFLNILLSQISLYFFIYL